MSADPQTDTGGQYQPPAAGQWHPAAPQWPQPARTFGSRNVRAGVATLAAAVVFGGGVAGGVSVGAKKELCDKLGNPSTLFVQQPGDVHVAATFEAAAQRLHTLSGRLIWSGDLRDAGEGLADALDSATMLYRAGFTDTSEVSDATAAHMDAVGLSVMTNLSSAQRACGLPATGLATPA
jgi:hypothetical protein